MDYKKIALFCNYISKDYSEEIFRLLLSHHNISASEAASRLDLHIRTVQEFLEATAEFGLLHKEEVYEKKRPYFRYSLKKKKLSISFDLEELLPSGSKPDINFKIRERKNSGAKFTTARSGQFFSKITFWKGEGREGKHRTINLTVAQGTFLYYLPFPDAEALGIDEIIKRAKISKQYISEIKDIIDEMIQLGIIEKLPE